MSNIRLGNSTFEWGSVDKKSRDGRINSSVADDPGAPILTPIWRDELHLYFLVSLDFIPNKCLKTAFIDIIADIVKLHSSNAEWEGAADQGRVLNADLLCEISSKIIFC